MRKRFKPVKFVSFLELSNDPNELLELLSQCESLNVQAENELKLRRSERDLIKSKLRKVRTNIDEITVSDHAVVRYLERVTGLDIMTCKKEMLSKLPKTLSLEEPVEFIQITADGLHYVIRDNLIISVTPLKELPSKQTNEDSKR